MAAATKASDVVILNKCLRSCPGPYAGWGIFYPRYGDGGVL